MKITVLSSGTVYKDQKLRSALKRLTLVGSSWMRGALNQKLKGTIIIARNDDDKVIGWAMLSIRDGHLQVTIYVKGKFRRRGIGTALLTRAKLIAKRRGKTLVCCPWDSVSTTFFGVHGLIEEGCPLPFCFAS